MSRCPRQPQRVVVTGTCGRRPISGLGVCVLERGHKSDHQDDAGRSWPSSKKRVNPTLDRGNGLKRGAGPKRVSAKGDERNGWLQAILYGKLMLQADFPEGFHCETCGVQFGDTIEEALTILQPGHIEERRHDPGKGVRFGSGGKVTRIGTDSWANVAPICQVCNREQDRAQRTEPEWTAS